MNFANQKGYKPFSVVYRFTEKEINQLVNDFAKETFGAELGLRVGCLDEEYDVYVDWDAEDVDDIEAHYGTEVLEKIEEFGLNPQEWFMNRDYLFQAIFQTPSVGYTCLFAEREGDEVLYEINIIHANSSD